MREDYYRETAEHAALATLMAESQVLVPPMTTAELRAGVEWPAREAGRVLEPGLAQAIVDDVAREPGSLRCSPRRCRRRGSTAGAGR
jgi:hypothetical protein